MEKRIITISREFGSGGRFIGEEVAKKLGISYYDKDCLRRKAYLPMHFPDVISQGNQWKIWCMKHRET